MSPLILLVVRRKAGLERYWEGLLSTDDVVLGRFLSTQCLMSMIAANPQIPESRALSHHLAYTGSLESHYSQNQCH